MTSQSKANLLPRPGLHTAWRIFRLLLAYSTVWLVLTGADPASWILGGPAVLLAAGVSFALARDSRPAINPLGVLLFFPYFVVLSIRSGIDVLRRTFSRGPRINPAIVSYRTGLQASGRIFLVNVISLLPGTLSADLHEDEISVHVLDKNIPVQKNIENLEIRIKRIFLRKSTVGGRT